MISKEFQQLFESLSHNRDRSSVFTDFMDYCLYILSAGMIREEYIALEKKYEEKDLTVFRRLLDIVAEQSEGFTDVLGEVFMQFVSHGHNGQFFTPTHVSDLMATISNCEELQSDQTVCDPACGSGRMLLSAVKCCTQKDNNIRPHCYGADIDLLCVKMSVINMVLNSIPGEIAWMNTITMEHWRSYHIELMLICGIWFPSLKVTEAGETNFVESLKKTMEEKPEMVEIIKEKIESRQLTFDF